MAPGGDAAELGNAELGDAAELAQLSQLAASVQQRLKELQNAVSVSSDVTKSAEVQEELQVVKSTTLVDDFTGGCEVWCNPTITNVDECSKCDGSGLACLVDGRMWRNRGRPRCVR